jgi:hypothetical protein
MQLLAIKALVIEVAGTHGNDTLRLFTVMLPCT